MDKLVTIYTDGACRGNPGPGGWGAVFLYGDSQKEIYGGESETTNNRMEMTAVIESLRHLKRACTVHLYTDSAYVKDGLEKWLRGWKARGWKTADGKKVKNQELWVSLEEQMQRHRVTLHWVKGHAGNLYNERADELARAGIPAK